MPSKTKFAFKTTAGDDVTVGTNATAGLKKRPPKSHGSDDLSTVAVIYMALLALQFALQPVFSAKYSPTGVDKTLIVMITEACKCVVALLMLFISSPRTADFAAVLSTWTLQDWLKCSGLPAVLYAVQNIFLLLAYDHLTGVEFNVINQTKTVSAAVFCYVLMGRRQTVIQMAALLMVGVGAITIEGTLDVAGIMKNLFKNGELGLGGGGGLQVDATRTFKGVVPCLIASGISGLAGAITQKILQAEKGGKNSYLYSCQLSFFSLIYLSASYFYSHKVSDFTSDVVKIFQARSYFPIINQALGGILVGLVTKYAGSVRKGFALIGGILLTAMMQSYAYDKPLTQNQEIGGCLAVVAMYTHANFGPGWREKLTADKKRDSKKKQQQVELSLGGKKVFKAKKSSGSKVKEQ